MKLNKTSDKIKKNLDIPRFYFKIDMRISILRNSVLRYFQRRFTSHSPTFHEESASGLNGRLARLAHSSSPSELISFYTRLGPASLAHLNLDSFNYIISAFLRDGQQMAAFKLISQLEQRTDMPGFPDKSTFTILMNGLVEADISGSLAATVDELFELMQKRYKIKPDLTCWSLRIRAFLHSKFLNPSTPNLEPARIFYHEMLTEAEVYTQNLHELNELRADLVVTAVSRRLWSFADWILTELPGSPPNLFNDKIANATGLFVDASSIPILRYLIKCQKQKSTHAHDDSIVNSFGFNQQLLLFCWRQGRFTSDLAFHALRFLISSDPNHTDWWIETAEGCFNRELPRDYFVFETEEAKDRLINLIHKLKCQESEIKEFEQEILHHKLLKQ